MRENARQGFWNGARPPFGYRTADAEKRGQKVKKVLTVDEAEAAVVRDIFDLAFGRAGMPSGVKAIVNHLNGSARQHRGKAFHLSSVHRIPRRPPTPASIISTEPRLAPASTSLSMSGSPWPCPRLSRSRTVQASLHARRLKRVPPRIVGNPTSLTGLARCATCDSGMTLRTGKSGRYRYYTRAGCAQTGKTFCPARSIPMAKLDDAVLEHQADRLSTPERLTVILEAFIARSANADSDRRTQLAQGRRALTEAEGAISRLLQLVERGLIEVNDPSLKEGLDGAKLT
jgi:site-specific DNA recombinase